MLELSNTTVFLKKFIESSRKSITLVDEQTGWLADSQNVQ